MPTRILTIGLLAACLHGAGGCAGPHYGSPTVSATVDASPERARVYIIPHEVWLQHGGAAMLDSPDLLTDHRRGVSPVRADLKRNRRYIFVTERGGRYEWIERTVTEENREFLVEWME